MKRLIFLIWLMAIATGWGYDKVVALGDSAYFNLTHTSAIDSAQLILIRGSVNDTLSLMPITGASHKIVEWENVFNIVDSSGSYQAWIETYSSGAVTDTVIGTCRVEPEWFDASADGVIVDSIPDDVITANKIATNAIGNDELADDIHIDSLSLESVTIFNSTTTDPAFYVKNSGGGHAVHFENTVGIGKSGLYLSSSVGTGTGLGLSGGTKDILGTIDPTNFETDAINANALATGAVTEITDGVWDKDTIDAFAVAAGIGKFIKDSTTGSGGGVTAEQVKDAVWGQAIDTAFAAGSMGDSAKTWAGGGSGGLTAEEGAQLDSLITILRDSVYAATGFQALTDSPPARYGTLHEKAGNWMGTGTDDLKNILGSYAARTMMATLDSLLDRVGPFGDSSVSSTPFTLYYWLQAVLDKKIDSLKTSLGFDASDDLHTKVDALLSTGGGTEPETLIVLDTADSTQIQGARITVRTIDQSTVKVPGLTTDVNGKRILELDVDSFYVAVTDNNYVETTDTLVVASGGGTDTLFMTQFDPGSPADENETRVWGYIYGGVGKAEIVAKIPQDFWPIYFEDEPIVARRTTKSDGTGYWFIDIPANSLLSDTTSVWEFIGKYGSETILGPCQKEVLDSTTQKLIDCEAY